jgi:hypothetical protein
MSTQKSAPAKAAGMLQPLVYRSRLQNARAPAGSEDAVCGWAAGNHDD